MTNLGFISDKFKTIFYTFLNGFLFCFRGLAATVLVFILVGVTFMPDGPFIRPHPALWRAMLVLQILYQLVLVYILFQVRCVIFCEILKGGGEEVLYSD